MTSQHDIEIGIQKANKLRFDFDELMKQVPHTKLQIKRVNDLASKIKAQEDKLTKWCNEFDKRIKPLEKIPECENADKIFVARIPKQLKDHSKYLKEMEGFIKKEKYRVVTLDKQSGYLIDVYSFYSKKV